MQSFDFPSAEGKHLPLPAQVPCQQHHQSCIFVKSPWWKDRWYQSLKDKGVQCLIKLIPQTHSATYFLERGEGRPPLSSSSLLLPVCAWEEEGGRGGTKEGGRGSQATAAVTQISSHCLLLLPDHMKSHCTEKFCPAAWKALGCIEQNCTVMKITTLRCIEKYRVLMMTWKAHQLEHHFARLNTARKRANRDITKKHCGQSSEQITQMYLCYICHFPSRPTSTPTSLQ